MALINIPYGSIASSDTMNSNFQYLEDKILDANSSAESGISSLVSNIATINSRLDDISATLEDSLSELSEKIELYKNKLKLMVNKGSMLPNWNAAKVITLAQNTPYTALTNGYVLIIPQAASFGNITVNGYVVIAKSGSSSYDRSAQMLVVPVKKNDVINSAIALEKAYIVPSEEIVIENF